MADGDRVQLTICISILAPIQTTGRQRTNIIFKDFDVIFKWILERETKYIGDHTRSRLLKEKFLS
jgi:hypothetical protein